MTDAAIPEFLVSYLEQRDSQRAHAVTDKLASLSDRERALVKDAAVMGYVRGRMHPQDEPHPKDSHVVREVVDACTAFPDLYPAISALGLTPRSGDDSREEMLKQRAWLIACTHLSEEVLRERAEAFQLYPEHMDIWRTVEGIDYLLADAGSQS